MADVQIQQSPEGRNSGAAWAVGVIVALLLFVVLWLVFADRDASAREETTINVDTPQTTTQVEVPKIEVPERIEVNLPEKVDINVNTEPPPKPKPQPPPKTQTSP